jgi:hypothetical protein
MIGVDLYRRKGGRKYLADTAAAVLPGVQVALARTAMDIASFAQSKLDASDRTNERYHSLPSPKVTVERRTDQKYGEIDYYVSLEAYAATESAALKRAIGIEFGHQYESYEKNPSGPWNRSEGLRVLAFGVDVVSAFNGF